jgi:hypothetical protein
VHPKKIGTFFNAGLTHFFLVLFINVKGVPLYRASVEACNSFFPFVEQNQWTRVGIRGPAFGRRGDLRLTDRS